MFVLDVLSGGGKVGGIPWVGGVHRLCMDVIRVPVLPRFLTPAKELL